MKADTNKNIWKHHTGETGFEKRSSNQQLDDSREYGIWKTIVQPILRYSLKKRELCSCFKLCNLTNEQWQQWVSHIEDFLEMIENYPDFIDSIITGDES